MGIGMMRFAQWATIDLATVKIRRTSPNDAIQFSWRTQSHNSIANMTDQLSSSKPGFVQRVFSLDLRSLAVFRIAVGILILADLGFRWSTLTDMYTGEGFYTHALADKYYQVELGQQWPQYVWSLYWISDSVIFVQSLFAVAAVAALFLIAGKWTRIATIVSWLLLASLQFRNPLVTTSGDFLFKMLLFWSMFLPLGAKWSVDALKKPTEHTAVCSFATIGLIFQMFAVYFFSGVAKCNEIWFSGNAMWYVLRLDIYITEFGRSMLEYPGALKLVSWLTLFAEVAWIWTLFVPWRNDVFRLSNIAIFGLFHIGIALSMAIGLFPAICVVGWLALLPHSVWLKQKSALSIRNYIQLNAISTSRLAAELFCLTVLVLVIAWNIANIDHPLAQKLRVPILAQLVHQTGLAQEFQMFGKPPKVNPWFVYEAQLADGSKKDIFRGEELQLARPARGLEKMPQFHWRKMHRNAVHSRRKVIRQPMLDYAVKRWNQTHDASQHVIRAKLIFFKEDIGPDYNALNHASAVWGNYEDESQSAGSLFDSMLKEQSPF